MRGQTGERWRQLCEQAAIEEDGDRLLKLVQEISRRLDVKTMRLERQQEQVLHSAAVVEINAAPRRTGNGR